VVGKKAKFVVGPALIVLAVAYLIWTGIKETSVYYLTIEEFLPRREALAHQRLRVAGRVKDGSLRWDAKSLDLRFSLQHFDDAGRTLPVHYRGLLPDMFAEGRDVIVEGEYDGARFEAHTVMTSCPSKYEPAPAGAGDVRAEAGR
jgi:cytochrome c-type biogenesis protein CcmE